MQFAVTVARVEHRLHVFYVEAADRRAALDVALEEAESHDFSTDPAEAGGEEIVAVSQVDTKTKERP